MKLQYSLPVNLIADGQNKYITAGPKQQVFQSSSSAATAATTRDGRSSAAGRRCVAGGHRRKFQNSIGFRRMCYFEFKYLEKVSPKMTHLFVTESKMTVRKNVPPPVHVCWAVFAPTKNKYATILPSSLSPYPEAKRKREKYCSHCSRYHRDPSLFL